MIAKGALESMSLLRLRSAEFPVHSELWLYSPLAPFILQTHVLDVLLPEVQELVVVSAMIADAPSLHGPDVFHHVLLRSAVHRRFLKHHLRNRSTDQLLMQYVSLPCSI